MKYGKWVIRSLCMLGPHRRVLSFHHPGHPLLLNPHAHLLEEVEACPPALPAHDFAFRGGWGNPVPSSHLPC